MLRFLAVRFGADLRLDVDDTSGLQAWRHARRAFAALSERRRLRRAEQELQHFDDHMLNDIGISRSEIAHVVRWGRGFGDRGPE